MEDSDSSLSHNSSYNYVAADMSTPITVKRATKAHSAEPVVVQRAMMNLVRKGWCKQLQEKSLSQANLMEYFKLYFLPSIKIERIDKVIFNHRQNNGSDSYETREKYASNGDRSLLSKHPTVKMSARNDCPSLGCPSVLHLQQAEKTVQPSAKGYGLSTVRQFLSEVIDSGQTQAGLHRLSKRVQICHKKAALPAKDSETVLDRTKRILAKLRDAKSKKQYTRSSHRWGSRQMAKKHLPNRVLISSSRVKLMHSLHTNQAIKANKADNISEGNVQSDDPPSKSFTSYLDTLAKHQHLSISNDNSSAPSSSVGSQSSIPRHKTMPDGFVKQVEPKIENQEDSKVKNPMQIDKASGNSFSENNMQLENLHKLSLPKKKHTKSRRQQNARKSAITMQTHRAPLRRKNSTRNKPKDVGNFVSTSSINGYSRAKEENGEKLTNKSDLPVLIPIKGHRKKRGNGDGISTSPNSLRLTLDFPRHNWLEHKYEKQQRNVKLISMMEDISQIKSTQANERKIKVLSSTSHSKNKVKPPTQITESFDDSSLQSSSCITQGNLFGGISRFTDRVDVSIIKEAQNLRLKGSVDLLKARSQAEFDRPISQQRSLIEKAFSTNNGGCSEPLLTPQPQQLVHSVPNAIVATESPVNLTERRTGLPAQDEIYEAEQILDATDTSSLSIAPSTSARHKRKHVDAIIADIPLSKTLKVPENCHTRLKTSSGIHSDNMFDSIGDSDLVICDVFSLSADTPDTSDLSSSAFNLKPDLPKLPETQQSEDIPHSGSVPEDKSKMCSSFGDVVDEVYAAMKTEEEAINVSREINLTEASGNDNIIEKTHVNAKGKQFHPFLITNGVITEGIVRKETLMLEKIKIGAVVENCYVKGNETHDELATSKKTHTLAPPTILADENALIMNSSPATPSFVPTKPSPDAAQMSYLSNDDLDDSTITKESAVVMDVNTQASTSNHISAPYKYEVTTINGTLQDRHNFAMMECKDTHASPIARLAPIMNIQLNSSPDLNSTIQQRSCPGTVSKELHTLQEKVLNRERELIKLLKLTTMKEREKQIISARIKNVQSNMSNMKSTLNAVKEKSGQTSTADPLDLIDLTADGELPTNPVITKTTSSHKKQDLASILALELQHCARVEVAHRRESSTDIKTKQSPSVPVLEHLPSNTIDPCDSHQQEHVQPIRTTSQSVVIPALPVNETPWPLHKFKQTVKSKLTQSTPAKKQFASTSSHQASTRFMVSQSSTSSTIVPSSPTLQSSLNTSLPCKFQVNAVHTSGNQIPVAVITCPSDRHQMAPGLCPPSNLLVAPAHSNSRAYQTAGQQFQPKPKSPGNNYQRMNTLATGNPQLCSAPRCLAPHQPRQYQTGGYLDSSLKQMSNIMDESFSSRQPFTISPLTHYEQMHHPDRPLMMPRSQQVTSSMISQSGRQQPTQVFHAMQRPYEINQQVSSAHVARVTKNPPSNNVSDESSSIHAPTQVTIPVADDAMTTQSGLDLSDYQLNPMHSTISAHIECKLCKAPAAFLCSGCSSAPYCTAECQHTDWAVHKWQCDS